MPEFYADDKARERRLAEIRARRGTAEREAHLAKIAEVKEKEKQDKAKRKTTSSSPRKTRENSTEFHGHTWDEWDAMVAAGLALVRERGAQRQLTTYTDVWGHLTSTLGKELGNAYFQIPALLEHMTIADGTDDGLIISALVQSDAPEPSPGAGFFSIAAAKGLFPAADAPKSAKDWTMTDTQRAFWQQQVDALFAKFGS